MHLLTYSADRLIVAVRLLGPLVGGPNGLFPGGLLPHRSEMFGTSIAASDLDGDGLVEVAVGMAGYEVPFSAKHPHDVYKGSAAGQQRRDQGAVLMFTLGFGSYSNDTSASASAIRSRLNAAREHTMDRALVVPGSVRFMSVPERDMASRSLFGRSVALLRSPFTSRDS